MDSVTDFFRTAPVWAWSIVSVLMAVVLIVALWDKVKWWWLNTWYSVPVIGKIASLSRDINRPDEAGWHKAELTLCRDYKKFIRLRSEQDFNEKVSYLTKARDLGRTPMPVLIWLLTVFIVIVEALGFSYVLAGYTIPGASENTQQMGAIGIAFLVSVVLVAFTHFSGHEIYKTLRAKEARREWVDAGRQPRQIRPVALAAQQSVDDQAPSHDQFANRYGTSGSFVITTVTAILVVVVAIGATYVRGQVLEKQLQQQITGQLTEGSDAAVVLNMGAASLTLNGNTVALPNEDQASDQAAKRKSLEDEKMIDIKGGWGTFIVLAFLFVFIQILGIIFGFKWGFVGRESNKAYAAIGGYSSYDDVRERYRVVADAAQAKLETLQQRMMERDASTGASGIQAKRTFHEFMEAENDREHEQRERERSKASRNSAMPKDNSPPTLVPARPTPHPAPVVAVPPPLPVAPPVPEPEIGYFYLNASRQPEGPQPLSFIHSQIAAGLIPSNTMVAAIGATEWRAL